jgi:NodT family efflux transporter outer membrane factor (OMF) lipoprotein
MKLKNHLPDGTGIILSILLLASCSIIHPYQRPVDIADKNLYRNSNSTDTNSIGNLPWNNLFRDSILQSLLTEGIQNNTDLKIALARIKLANASFKQSKQALLPSLNLTANPVFQNIPAQFGVPQTYQLFAGAAWEADLWGKLKSSKRASLLLLLQSEAYKRAVQTQLIADIASNYFLLMAYDEQLQITEKTVANRKEEVETMKILKESDVVTGAAVVQSQANRYSVEITIPDLKQHIHELENAISILLGKAPDTLLRSKLQDQQINVKLEIGLPIQLLANRPDVQEAEYQLRSSLEMENVARTYFYPDLSLTASTGLVNTGIAQLFSPTSFFANLSGNLIQPLFSQGLNQQRLAIARANSEANLVSFRKSLLTAGQEVSDALYSYQTAVEKETLRLQQISFLQKSVDYTKELLNYSSKANYTDVLTSEQSLLAAQLNSISDKLQELTAVVNLYRSLGGGWK